MCFSNALKATQNTNYISTTHKAINILADYIYSAVQKFGLFWWPCQYWNLIWTRLIYEDDIMLVWTSNNENLTFYYVKLSRDEQLTQEWMLMCLPLCNFLNLKSENSWIKWCWWHRHFAETSKDDSFVNNTHRWRWYNVIK